MSRGVSELQLRRQSGGRVCRMECPEDRPDSVHLRDSARNFDDRRAESESKHRQVRELEDLIGPQTLRPEATRLMSNRPNRRRRHSTPEGNAPALLSRRPTSCLSSSPSSKNKDQEDDKKKGRARKEKSITLKELALLAKAQGCQSAAGARALLQKAAPDRSSALALMQVAIRKAQSEGRKRVLVRDVEVVVGVLAELRRCVAAQSRLSLDEEVRRSVVAAK